MKPPNTTHIDVSLKRVFEFLKENIQLGFSYIVNKTVADLENCIDLNGICLDFVSYT